MPGNGSIRERKPGVWEVRVYLGEDERGRPVQVSRTVRGGKREANAKRTELLAAAASNRVKLRSERTFGEYLDEWLTHISSRREVQTVKGYRSHIRAIKAVKAHGAYKPPLGDKPLDGLRTEDLDAAYAVWLKSGRSMATVRHRHNIIGAALEQAVKWRRVVEDVSDAASPPPLRTRPIPRVQPADVQTLIRAAELKNATLATAVALAAVLGARRGELCGLRWADLDLTEGLLYIERAAKHNLDGDVILGDTKNHRTRRLALDPFALEVLSRARTTALKVAADAGIELAPDAFVLTPPMSSPSFDPSGATPVRPDYITQAHRTLSKGLGLPVRFHDLRHFAATELIRGKVDPVTAAGRLGNDRAVLLRTYAAAVAEADREAASVVGRVLTSAG